MTFLGLFWAFNGQNHPEPHIIFSLITHLHRTTVYPKMTKLTKKVESVPTGVTFVCGEEDVSDFGVVDDAWLDPWGTVVGVALEFVDVTVVDFVVFSCMTAAVDCSIPVWLWP